MVALNDDVASRWGPRIVDLLRTGRGRAERPTRRAGGRPARGQAVTTSRPVPVPDATPPSRPGRPGRPLPPPGAGPPPSPRRGPGGSADSGRAGGHGGNRGADHRDDRRHLGRPGRVWSLPDVGQALLARLPWHPHLNVSAVNVGHGLAGAHAAGGPGGARRRHARRQRGRLPRWVRNPLADPYLLGVAAGGGLGATLIIVTGAPAALLPPAAFAGAVIAVALTYLLGTGAGGGPARSGWQRSRHRAGRGRGGGAAHRPADLPPAAALAEPAGDLRVDSGRARSLSTWSDVTLILPVCRPERPGCTRPSPPARRAPYRRDRGSASASTSPGCGSRW